MCEVTDLTFDVLDLRYSGWDSADAVFTTVKQLP